MTNTPRGIKDEQVRACNHYRGRPIRNHKILGGDQIETKLSITYERHVPSRTPDQQNARVPGCGQPTAKPLHVKKDYPRGSARKY
jgi:hypothetical protein